VPMPASSLPFADGLSPAQIADLRLAASKMTGATRRAFEAEMTLQYWEGNPLWAETVFGWGRQTVALGLAEKRTGIMCLGAQSAVSGRHRWEDKHPPAAEALCHLAASSAQQDPTFRTRLASTRLTSKAALRALRHPGGEEAELPSPGTMAKVLNRLGFRLRKVVKANPQKQVPETDAIFDHLKKKTSTPPSRRASNA
jgi:Rhodopirellula transposase DDE domain